MALAIIEAHNMASTVANEKGPSGPIEDAASDGSNEVATAANGNVMDGGLQRGLKNRHLVSPARCLL